MKTIALADDAYARLAALKRPNESFSDVVRRLTGAESLAMLAGTMDESTASHYRTNTARARRREDAARSPRVSGMRG